MSKSILLVTGCLMSAAIGDRLMQPPSPEAAYQDGFAKGVDRGIWGARGAAVTHECGEFYLDAAGEICFRWIGPQGRTSADIRDAPALAVHIPGR